MTAGPCVGARGSEREHPVRMGAGAAQLASYGWSIFPVGRGSKRPISAHAFLDATTDASTVAAWWRRWPSANIGIATGAEFDLVVVDVDARHNGYQSLAELQSRSQVLPDTLTVETGGGGLHLYFRHPGGRVKSRANALGPGLDIRGDGGCVVVPPSVHSSGRRYCWRDTSVPIAEMPSWLAALVQSQPPVPRPRLHRPADVSDGYVRAALEGELRAARSAQEPGRNHQLNRSAYCIGQLVGDGCLDRELARELLIDAGLACGLPEREVRTTVRSGLDAGHANPRGVRVGGRR